MQTTFSAPTFVLILSSTVILERLARAPCLPAATPYLPLMAALNLAFIEGGVDFGDLGKVKPFLEVDAAHAISQYRRLQTLCVRVPRRISVRCFHASKLWATASPN